MRFFLRLLIFSYIVAILSSCEFRCSVGENSTEKNEVNKPVMIDGAAVYNGIELHTNIISLKKAYLIYSNGERVPEDNFVDFADPVKLILILNSGWNEQDGKVALGASEKVKDEGGNIILDEKDLFSGVNEITSKDAKIIGLTLTLRLKKEEPPTSFVTYFRVWDKNGEGYIEGNYKLYTK